MYSVVENVLDVNWRTHGMLGEMRVKATQSYDYTPNIIHLTLVG